MVSHDTLLNLCGIHSVALGLFHVTFWKLFNWQRELKNNTAVARATMQIFNIHLIYVFFAVAGIPSSVGLFKC
jgi:hypothetical protein